MLLLCAAASLAGEPWTFVPGSPVFEVGFEGETVRVRNTGSDPLLLDGIGFVDPSGWTAPGDLPSLVAPGAEISVDLARPGNGGLPETILVRTGSGVAVIHPDGIPGLTEEQGHSSAARAALHVAAGAARGCSALKVGDDQARVLVDFRVGPDRRVESAWVEATTHRSGAVEQCVVDAVRDPGLKFPPLAAPGTYGLEIGFPAVRRNAPLLAKRWDDVLVLVNELDQAVVVEEIDVVDGDGMRVEVERPVRIPAERQRTFAVQGERPVAAQLLIRTSVGVQVEPNWEPIRAGGALLQADIDRVLAEGEERIQACRVDPKLTGAVSVRLGVTADGSVGEASVNATSLPAGSVEQCVLDEVRGLRFPAPTGGGPVPVATAFAFR